MSETFITPLPSDVTTTSNGPGESKQPSMVVKQKIEDVNSDLRILKKLPDAILKKIKKEKKKERRKNKNKNKNKNKREKKKRKDKNDNKHEQQDMSTTDGKGTDNTSPSDRSGNLEIAENKNLSRNMTDIEDFTTEATVPSSVTKKQNVPTVPDTPITQSPISKETTSKILDPISDTNKPTGGQSTLGKRGPFLPVVNPAVNHAVNPNTGPTVTQPVDDNQMINDGPAVDDHHAPGDQHTSDHHGEIVDLPVPPDINNQSELPSDTNADNNEFPPIDLPPFTEEGMGKPPLITEGAMDFGGADSHEGHVHVEFKQQRFSKTLRRMCKRDYYGIPKGRKCCLRSVNCFSNLPDLINEVHLFEQEHINEELVCRHVKGALTCMGKTLNQPECLDTAKAINDKFKPQLETITHFFDPECLDGFPDLNFTTTVPPSHPGKGGGHRGTASIDHVYTGAIGAAIGGAILLLVFVIGCLFWRRKKHTRRRRSEKREEKNNEANHKTESARYKTVGVVNSSLARQTSDVYAEIDEGRMKSVKGERKTSEDSRPLPSAPNADNALVTDKSGYLTPKDTPDKAAGAGGYAILYTDKDGTVSYTRTYTSLSDDDGDYIFPDNDESAPKRRIVNKTEGQELKAKTADDNIKPVRNNQEPTVKTADDSNTPTVNNQEQPYHAYFILEKDENLTKTT